MAAGAQPQGQTEIRSKSAVKDSGSASSDAATPVDGAAGQPTDSAAAVASSPATPENNQQPAQNPPPDNAASAPSLVMPIQPGKPAISTESRAARGTSGSEVASADAGTRATDAGAVAGEADPQIDASAAFSTALQDALAPEEGAAPHAASHAASNGEPATAAASGDVSGGAKTIRQHPSGAPDPAPPPAPEARFAETNHAHMVTGMKAELLPNGGSMQIRLDPPELGDLQVTVQMRDGVMTAAFQTSNEQATRLLSHSLSNLKSLLESQGVNVEKLHVQQAAKQEQGGSSDTHREPTPEERHSAQREQQRREMIQRMWKKLGKGGDPLDLVA
jgi:flagellar hook-length control protein FliK